MHASSAMLFVMLVKVQYQGVKKFVKLHSDGTFQDFISEVKSKFALPTTAALEVFDTDTTVEEDIFHELIEGSPHLCLTVRCPEDNISAGLSEVFSPTRSSTPSTCTDTLSLSSTDHEETERVVQNQATMASNSFDIDTEKAKLIVQNALENKSGGEEVLEEYQRTKTLKHSTRRQLVNIVVSHMTEIHGRIPPRKQRETYALGIISLFPSLRDPFSTKGYEHFYDPEKGTGFISWRLKTLSRKNPKRVRLEMTESGGPNRRRRIDHVQQLEGDSCREAISFLVHTADEAEVMQKMKETFKHRQELVHNPERSSDVLDVFPRYLDVKGLINQDFGLLFNAETSNKFLERWETAFKQKIIKEAQSLNSTAEIRCLLSAAGGQGSENDWDSAMSSVLLLLHLLPPAPGRKKTKISPSEAIDRLVHFHKSCTSIEGHLGGREGHQPFLLGSGRIKGKIDHFYIVVDKRLIPCAGTSSLSAFDELFKVHYVFNLSYEEALVNFFTFLQTTVYNIDVGLSILADLSSPQNLTLETLNTRYILHWDWAPEMAVNGTVTFTAQFLAQYKARKPPHKQDWKSVCADVVEPHCDFSDAGLLYFGMYLLRVQAKTAQQSSRWVQKEFCPDKHAALGPPSSVMLNSVKDGLEIVISDPLDRTNQSMKELSQKMYYLIQYWKKYEDTQKAEILRTNNNVVTLSELDKWTWYCVRVQSRCEFYNKTSVFTDTFCTQTAEETTYLQIFLYFLLSLVLCFLLVLILSFGSYKAYKTLKNVFYPTIQLPLYIQEHWAADSPWLLIPESETFCEHLDVNSAAMNAAVTVVDAHIAEQDQDTETHSRHDSKDSGFNSTEEDSSPRQYGLAQHIRHNNVQMEDKLCKIKHREETQDDEMQEFCV